MPLKEQTTKNLQKLFFSRLSLNETFIYQKIFADNQIMQEEVKHVHKKRHMFWDFFTV